MSSPGDSESSTDSVESVEPKWILPQFGDKTSVSVKCNKCNTSTIHFLIAIQPVPLEEMNPMDVLKASKRLLLCTQCANMSLKN